MHRYCARIKRISSQRTRFITGKQVTGTEPMLHLLRRRSMASLLSRICISHVSIPHLLKPVAVWPTITKRQVNLPSGSLHRHPMPTVRFLLLWQVCPTTVFVSSPPTFSVGFFIKCPPFPP